MMNSKELIELKKLLINFSIFFIIFVSLDNIVNLSTIPYIKYRNLNTKSGLEYALYKKSEILIFGASQAEVGYNSKLISKLTGLRTANLAQSLSNSTYSYILFKQYIEKYKPKFVIYDASWADTYDQSYTLKNTKKFGYLYGKDKDVDSILTAIVPYTRMSLFFSLYRYRYLLIDILRNNQVVSATDKFLNFKSDNGSNIDKLLALEKKGLADNFYSASEKNEVDPSSISYKCFNKILQLCRDNGIKIILVYNIKYGDGDLSVSTTPMPEYFKSIPQDNIVSFFPITLARYPYFKEKKYYRDLSHLNGLGADSLSTIVSRIINEKLKM